MRCVIIGAAEITTYERIKTYLRNDDFFIFCDGGLSHEKHLGVKPDLIVGDFDSFKKPETQVETITLPREKDDTDVFYAVKEALKRGFTDFLLLGVMGQRLDHTIVNFSVLLYLKEHNSTALILDDYSELELVGKEPVTVSPEFSYFSLLCIDGAAAGITIKNAKWPLENGSVSPSYIYTSSNQVLPGKTASVSVEKGVLLLCRVF